MATTTDVAWAIALARSTGYAAGPGQPLRWVETPSGADLAVVGDVVVKLHHPRTDPSELERRLAAISGDALREVFVQPLTGPRPAPDGRLATAWPRIEVLTEESPEIPWAPAGALLAALHRAPAPPDLPAHGGPARVARALLRVSTRLVELGTRLLREAREPARRPPGAESGLRVVHGDWHLGQLARTDAGLRLLDVDDLGIGDPAWDLGRPAGFWAAGLLDDDSWRTFLDAYRAAGGPAVPTAADPWPSLDLAARCAVFVATVRELSVQPAHSGDPALSLLAACARM